MLRSQLIKIATLVVLGFGSFSCDNVQENKDYVSQETRTKYNFNLEWKFIKENPENAQELGFDDVVWSTVSCPHTFNDIDTFDDLSHGHHDGEGNHWRGTVWYRKHFMLPAEDANKKVFIEFEGVRQIADVYINGKFLGQNQTGFIPFGFDLTPYLKFGENNVLAVKVNNDRGDHFRDNFPLVWHHEHWHPNHGGIYRNVFLHVTDPLHITLPLYDNLETLGTYVYSENITAENADVTINAEVQNEYPDAKKVVYEAKIIDNDGKVVATASSEKSIEAGDKYMFSVTTSVSNPKRWYTRHPYMYNVETILKVDGKAIDSYNTPLGIRSFNFDKDKGFFNNGEYAKLHGWGQKPTNSWAGLGAALPDWLRDYTYQLMDEAGGNFIRWGHCAGSPAEIAMGDKYGFVTLMPGVSGESQDDGETWNIRIKAFKDMIVYYRNHPSIFIWEGGNWAETEAHYQEILDVINTFDPNGKRLMGNRRADVKNDSEGYVSIEIGTEGWEREYPDLPIVESEYNREEAPRRIWDKYSPDDNFYSHQNIKKNTYKLNSEEFAVNQVDHWWEKMGKKTYHVGGANWVFTDGPHGGRCPTEVTRASGEVDAVRLPKEAFFATKAMWRPEPQVHIVGHWNYDENTIKDIFVVSNCQEVKLYVNDELVGTNSSPENGYIFKFDKVSWKTGSIKAEAYINSELQTSQIKQTARKPVALKLSSITGPQGWLADGSDIALVDVEVVDANGNRCPLAKGRVDFTFEGAGVWRGGYNSGKPNSINNLYLDIEAGINRVSVRSLLEAGNVSITASYEGLPLANISITSKPIKVVNGLTIELPQVYQDVLAEEPMPIYTPEIPEYIPGKTNKSKLFTKFSYTGDGKAMLRTNMHWGKKSHTDLEHNYTVIPRYLNKAEYIRTPNSDKNYWARDQLQFIAGVKMHIYVLHDDRVPRPEFLLEDYKDTGDNVKLDDAVMSVFHRLAEAGESIIMAGNSDGEVPEDAKMYTVIGKKF
ncbi:glycoside hydrolase family 2 protein [Seonamhaeicola sediminis]|uniref:Glycoside hydrolase family 2 protein n=1 Tax=Seonamhaeicola sediminis TaxID=2528206 RepID=A0A562YIH4_9FLAO|nr:sugar-binding domain-containing protein [Seonamhaeicola sediminis]TWO34531.1 glycoside hydrolase family 2 protein [Seonamhaeicola sediminis]